MADRLLFLTTADTEILAAARAADLLPSGFPEVRCINPTKLEESRTFFEETLPGTGAVMVRLLGGRRAWSEGLEELRRRCDSLGVPLLAFGGEAEPDAELAALSTAPSGIVAEGFEYLQHGGVHNTANLFRFVATHFSSKDTASNRRAAYRRSASTTRSSPRIPRSTICSSCTTRVGRRSE